MKFHSTARWPTIYAQEPHDPWIIERFGTHQVAQIFDGSLRLFVKDAGHDLHTHDCFLCLIIRCITAVLLVQLLWKRTQMRFTERWLRMIFPEHDQTEPDLALHSFRRCKAPEPLSGTRQGLPVFGWINVVPWSAASRPGIVPISPRAKSVDMFVAAECLRWMIF